MSRTTKRAAAVLGATVLLGAATGAAAMGAQRGPSHTEFHMFRSAVARVANCLGGASAAVQIDSRGPVEVMEIEAKHLPPRTDFDLFVIQVPDAPFGLSWYQGDLVTDGEGEAHGTFVGRFSIETFTVAPGTAPAPVVHHGPFPDASSNPATAPVHQYHLGLWFNSPLDAKAAGCPDAVTPFNGDHNAGVQALSTTQFPDDNGPLRRIRP